jgi:hypothetical protein
MTLMSEWELTLADVAREFPDWRPYRATSGLCFTHAPGGGQVMGEDPLDLRDQIRGWLGRHGDGEPASTQSPPDPAPAADDARTG